MLRTFPLDDKLVPVKFLQTQKVTEGVVCDVYHFPDDPEHDLAIYRVKRQHKTPQRRVAKGERTLEGWVAGSGTLFVTTPSGETRVFEFRLGQVSTEVSVKVGEIMQWHAHPLEDLTFYEICQPPFSEDRFEIIEG